MARRGRPSTMVSVDFTDVDAGGIEVEDGRHPAVVKGCESETSDNGEYLAWRFRLTGDTPATVYDNTSLQPQALWRLRGLLTALGMETPDGPFRLNRKDVLELPIELDIVNEEWGGKNRPKVVGYAPLDDEDLDDDLDDEDIDDEDIDDERADTIDAEAPRKRGRPRKAEAEAPRKRGRPRKDEDIDEAPRKRGRPRKAEAEAPRRRGRKPGLKTGMQVVFEDEGEEFEGKILGLEGDSVTVITEDDEEWELSRKDVSPA